LGLAMSRRTTTRSCMPEFRLKPDQIHDRLPFLKTLE
jgi:hypothetical protein